MRVYKWGPDWVIARSAADCALAVMEHQGLGEGDLEELLEEDPPRLGDEEEIGIRFDHRDDAPKVLPDGAIVEELGEHGLKITATAKAWVEVSSRGQLCSEEW